MIPASGKRKTASSSDNSNSKDRSELEKRQKTSPTGREIINISDEEKSASRNIKPTQSSTSVKPNMIKTLQPKKEAQPAKKLVIKNLKVKPKLPENFEEDTWKKLELAVKAIHNPTNQVFEHSKEELYRSVEDLCHHKWSATLYTRLQTECEEHIKSEVNKLVGQTSDPPIYLNLVNGTWQDHCKQMLLIRQIFLYLDRTYVIQNGSVKSLWDMGLQLFRTHVMSNEEVQRKTVASLLALIEQERRGETIDRSLVKDLLRMFVALQIYTDSFERAFLEATRAFYEAEGNAFINSAEVAEYLKHVEDRIHEEGERVLHYLDPATRKNLILTLENQLLQAHSDAILAKGFDLLMDANKREDLKRLYALFGRISALEKIKAAWNQYIKQTGAKILNDTEKDKSMVQELLDYRAKLDLILEEAFSRNESFANSLKEAFEFFINSRANKPAELIAKFVDLQLRSGSKTGSEEEVERILDRVMVLFRYIHGKDIFEAFYKKDLAKRLLLGKSASIDLEKSMVSKLKIECGASFTNKLEGMFKDIDSSETQMLAFKEYAQGITLPGNIDMNVRVLTQGYWPAYAPTELNLPKELSEYQDIFKKFYLAKHSGRKLTWQNGLGHCLVRASFKAAKKELFVSLFQTVVLLQFNNANGDGPITFKELQQATNIELPELKRTLASLSCGKVHVLLKEPKGRDVAEEDAFTFNKDFKHKLFKIKINSIQMKETVEENQKTTQNVFQDRQYQIDAAIVRIMKTRKTLTHNLLVSELYAQLKFPVKPADLKKRIESLIEREYMERDEQNSQVYKYLA